MKSENYGVCAIFARMGFKSTQALDSADGSLSCLHGIDFEHQMVVGGHDRVGAHFGGKHGLQRLHAFDYPDAPRTLYRDSIPIASPLDKV